MKNVILVFSTLCIFLFALPLEALERDISKDLLYEFNTYFCHDCIKFFRFFGKQQAWNEIDIYSSLIPTCKGKPCERCKQFFNKNFDGIYSPYLDWGVIDYFELLKDHLKYCGENVTCQCYWPEICEEAGKISDCAFSMFLDLFTNTALSLIVTSSTEQNNMLLSKPTITNKFSAKGIVIVFTNKAFFYSDYERICCDLDRYSKMHFDDVAYFAIHAKLENIKEILALKYLDLYKSCLSKHPNKRIRQEIIFASQLFEAFSILIYDQGTSIEGTKGFLVGNRKLIEEMMIAELVGLGLVHSETDSTFGQTPISQCITEESNDRESFTEHCQQDDVIALTITDKFYENSCLKHLEVNPMISQPDWLSSQILLREGSILNDFLLYKESIHILTDAIKLNPSNIDAYTERAMAYFETNQLRMAMQDYEMIKKLTFAPPFKFNSQKILKVAKIYAPENKIEFSKGLVSGTITGAKVSVSEFIPSIFSCCRGILHGLWAFVCSPKEVSQEMINTAYAIGEFISNHSTEECFHCVVPELKMLSISWDKLDDFTRGQNIGFIIGKYGVDIFAPVGILNGANKVRALKRANTICTLESCVSSQEKCAKIIKKSKERANIRQKIISESVKYDKILVRNSNAEVHIMQPRHAWDKVVKITGDVRADCKNVVKFLEEHNILHEKFRVNMVEHNKKFLRFDHEMQINEIGIKAVFNKNLETGELFLNDAWVITK